VAFLWINLDTRPQVMPGWVHQSSVAERFGESLLVIPLALLGGALLGALAAAILIVPLDALRWLRKKMRGTSATQD
jgi:hypothetical protein